MAHANAMIRKDLSITTLPRTTETQLSRINPSPRLSGQAYPQTNPTAE
jgi:hypothetical protein